VIVTLHDLTLAARTCDRVAVLSRGRLAAIGPPLAALSPAALAEVFGLSGVFVDSPAGPLLAADRTVRAGRLG
jgi:iron complex transport system ATP-binding protein